MSGHSRWAGIKHKKAIIDAKRGKTFTRLAREVTVAAREGGANPEHNPRLRKAMEDAREVNMPQDNIKKAIQRGTGELPGINYEELRYEGYGAGGVAILVDIVTDSKNRTASEIRKIFSDHHGNIAEAGAVSWMFSSKGYMMIEKNKTNEESLLNLALESGAEDMKSTDEEYFEIFTAPGDLEKVRSALQSGKIPIAESEITQISQTTIPLQGNDAENVLTLIRNLEDHDDVQKVYSNFDISKDIIDKVMKE